ncbi:hypothetical protein OBV_34270 [Oscillibacter valericigenes Sjm18-20]|nr:hypothetical protein OBV_34270 [Oscillibacter valericigenes Sjm18-20]
MMQPSKGGNRLVIKQELLMNVSDQMMRLRGELDEENEELTHIFQKLEQLSGVENVLELLRKSQKKLEQHAWYAYRQARALEQTARWYDVCERRIQAEYEDTAIHYPHSPGTAVDLSFVTEFLK